MSFDFQVEGLSQEVLKNAKDITSELNSYRGIIEKIKDKSTWSVIASILLSSIVAGGKKSISLVYSGSICGIRLVKHFMFHGIKVSMDLFKKLWSIISSVGSLKEVLMKPVEKGWNIHTIGSASTAGLVFIFMAILETLGSLIKYGWHSLYKRDGMYTWTRMIKDLKKIWAGNLIAAGVTTSVAAGLSSILIGLGCAVAWPFIVASIAASIVGNIAKWWYNNRESSNTLLFPEFNAKTKRDAIYNDWAKSDNIKNKQSRSGKVEWPEELDDLVWVFEAMECLKFVVNKSLDDDIIDTKYYQKTQHFTELKGMKKMEKLGIWEFRKAICLRYVQEIQNSKTKVEKCIVKACQVRHEQLNDDCSIM